MMSKTHYYISLGASPWPILTSLSVMSTMISILTLMKFGIILNLMISIAFNSMIAFNWWMSMKTELNKKGLSSEELNYSFKMSMTLFISSEILFFFSMFWAYQHFTLVPELEVSSMWPPYLLKMFDASSIPMLNTFILLTSGATVTLAHKLMIKKSKMQANIMKEVTILLGAIFSLLQYQEYKNSFFSLTDGTFGTSFFFLTGFHGMHVLIGTVFLLTNWINYLSMSNSDSESLSFEMAAWYWHFVDVVWMIVFYMIYFLNN